MAHETKYQKHRCSCGYVAESQKQQDEHMANGLHEMMSPQEV